MDCPSQDLLPILAHILLLGVAIGLIYYINTLGWILGVAYVTQLLLHVLKIGYENVKQWLLWPGRSDLHDEFGDIGSTVAVYRNNSISAVLIIVLISTLLVFVTNEQTSREFDVKRSQLFSAYILGVLWFLRAMM